MFSVNQITTLGANLLAQATAANPIEYIGAVASTTDHSAAALVDMGDPSDIGWDVNGGEIVACSATDTTARIIAGFSNRASEVTVKTIGVLGRLESQSDSEAVVVAAISDDSASITIPSEDLPPVMVMTAINIQISDSSLVIVTSSTAGSAMISDLDRLVSCHKAGQPNTGESQTIYGTKSFTDAIYATSGVVTPDITISGEDIQWTGYTNTSIGMFSGALTLKGESGIFLMSDAALYGDLNLQGSLIGNVLPRYNNTSSLGASGRQFNEIWAQTVQSDSYSGGTVMGSCQFFDPVDFDQIIHFGDGFDFSSDLSASNYPLIPSQSDIQMGGIFLAIITATFTGSGRVTSGATIPSTYHIYKAEAISDTPSGNMDVSTAKFSPGALLSNSGSEFIAINGFYIDEGKQVLTLVCRVSS